jgi:hypothetical protein
MGRCTSKNKPDGTIDPITDQGGMRKKAAKRANCPARTQTTEPQRGH